MHRLYRLLLITVPALIWLLLPSTVAAQEGGLQLPSGFAFETVASGFRLPMSMAFLPSGEIMVAEKGLGSDVDGLAEIRLIRNGKILEKPLLTLSVNAYWDSGLQSIVLDPDFVDNGYFYVMYNTGNMAPGWDGETDTRVSRFTYDAGQESADPATEMIVLEGIGWGRWHHGGGMRFDAEGNLYVATGDTSTSVLSQDLSVLNGKILRVRPSANGHIVPADNPFVDVEDARPEIFALGMRNPFRMTHDKSGDRLYVGDVGDIVWEEVNRIERGANFGWPLREGPCPKGKRRPCDPLPEGLTDPVVAYTHPLENWKDSNSITALAYCDGPDLPPIYQDGLFFADYNERSLSFVSGARGENGIQRFSDNIGKLTDMGCRDDGLYLLDMETGKLFQVYHTGAPNQIPAAVLETDVSVGPAPLTVQFDAGGSRDADDTVLRYHWEFGDGTDPTVTTTPLLAHTFARDGTYTASLQVVDFRGGASETVEKDITVYSGEMPRIELSILDDPARTHFYGADRIDYRAVRTGGTDGLDEEAPFQWQVDLQHNQHDHPIVTNQITDSGLFTVPVDNHGTDSNIALRFTLTMLTADGQPVAVSRVIEPAHVSIRVDSYPLATPILIDGVSTDPGARFTAVVGTEYRLDATDELLYEQTIQRFAYWHLAPGIGVQSAAPPRIFYDRATTITVPPEDTLLIAQYAYARPAEKVLLPFYQR